MLIGLHLIAGPEILRAERFYYSHVIWLKQLFVFKAGPKATVTLLFIVVANRLIW